MKCRDYSCFLCFLDFSTWALLFKAVEKNGHKPEIPLAEKNSYTVVHEEFGFEVTFEQFQHPEGKS